MKVQSSYLLRSHLMMHINYFMFALIPQQLLKIVMIMMVMMR
jgi:hypothetical protein